MAASRNETEQSNKAIKYLKKAVTKFKPLKLPSTATQHISKPQCFAICIDKLGPIQIPAFYIPSTQSNGKIEIIIHCSLFDSNQLCFVGRTWKSNPFPTNRNNEAVPIEKLWIYLKSIPYEAKWIVLELVAQIRSEGVIISQISLGWNVMKLFTNTRALIDVHPDENNNNPLQRESKLKWSFLFQGSPTYLLINNDIDSIPETPIKMSFRWFTFKKLINIAHLLSSETIVGPNNIIPGLGNTLKIPINPYHKSCKVLLNVEYVDFIVSSPILTLPEGFEPQILQQLTKIRKNNFCGSHQTTVKIVDRQFNIAFYNGRNIITTPTVIQLQQHSINTNTLSWDGDIKMRTKANIKHSCWLLISLNYHIEWKDDPSSAHAASHHHTVCLGRDLVNITSNELILDGSRPTELVLSSNYSWIDDCAIFNNIKTDKKQDIKTSFIIRLMTSNTMTQSVSHSAQISTKSTNKPTLSTIHHVSSFGWKDAVDTEDTNTLSIRSNTYTNSTNNNILPSPQGYVHTNQGMVAMNWDDIKKQSLMIPENVLQQKMMNTTSKLALLQESFAVNTWHRLQNATSTTNTKVLARSQSIRSFETIPNRKVVDLNAELSLSHKRKFSISCNALNIQTKQLLLNPIESIMIQLDFMGEKLVSPVIMMSANNTINNLRESLMSEDQYQSLPFDEAYHFEFNILPKQIRQFIQFLNEKYAIFTIIDANTLFHIGSTRICLRDFLIQSNSDIKDNIEIAISLTKITNHSSYIIETQPNMALNELQTTMKGQLCIQIIHETIDLSDTAKLQYVHWSNNLITNICDENGQQCVGKIKLIHSTNTRVRAEALYKNLNCTQKLQNLAHHERISYPTQTITTKWKIPIEAIHEISNQDEEWKTRRENIEIMNTFRDRTKQEMLNKLSYTDEFTIQPSLGQIVYFEMEFVNPWYERKQFNLKINDEELQLVTNIEEICYFKEKHNVSTAMNRHLFDKQKESMNHKLFTVNAQDKVYIPFKFESESLEIQKRSINVSIYHYDDEFEDKSCVIQFNISVEPIKFYIDRIFDIFTFENSKFVGTIPIPIPSNDAHSTLSAKCTNNNTAFEFDKNNENITFRVDVKNNNTNTFYFIIYNDKYFVDINEIWEINIHSYCNENCHGILGGIIKNNIHLPAFIDKVNCDGTEFHCDEPNGMQLQLIDNKLNVQYAPNDIGKKLMRIHCINNHNKEYSALLVMHIEMPPINNSFIIHIQNNESKESVTRKLPYNNGYNQDRDYELVSNDPSIIRVSNPVLHIPSRSTMEFVLQIMANNVAAHHSQEVLLFVTESGNLEQCLRIEVKTGKMTNL